ncbi:MAG TPA: universal stress protein [Terriglobia bacterium]|nr:universal stress protein [Terriglobia bacterium]
MFQRIFIAIDFSPSADEALRQAAHRAVSTGAKLTVCHILPNELRSNVLFPQISRIEALRIPLELDAIAAEAGDRVTRLTGLTANDFNLIVDEGTPYSTILAHAEEELADLIVVGSHGETGLSSGLLGSVTNRIIRYAHCPVLIVRAGDFSGGVVVGVDFSDPAMPAVRAAAAEADRTQTDLVLTHCLDLTWSITSYPAMAFGGAPSKVSPADVGRLESAASEKLNHILEHLGLKGRAEVAQGSAGKGLIDTATRLKARLLVVGTLGRTGLRRAVLGSVAETVAQGAPCSVLIVRQHHA